MESSLLALVGKELEQRGFACTKSRFGLTTFSKELSRGMQLEAVFEHGMGVLPSRTWKEFTAYTARNAFAATLLTMTLPQDCGDADDYSRGAFPLDRELEGLSMMSGVALHSVINQLGDKNAIGDNRVTVRGGRATILVAPFIFHKPQVTASRLVSWLVNYTYNAAASYSEFHSSLHNFRPERAPLRMPQLGFQCVDAEEGELSRYAKAFDDRGDFTVGISQNQGSYQLCMRLPGLMGYDNQKYWYALGVMPRLRSLPGICDISYKEDGCIGRYSHGEGVYSLQAPAVVEKKVQISFNDYLADLVVPLLAEYSYRHARAYSEAYRALMNGGMNAF